MHSPERSVGFSMACRSCCCCGWWELCIYEVVRFALGKAHFHCSPVLVCDYCPQSVSLCDPGLQQCCRGRSSQRQVRWPLVEEGRGNEWRAEMLRVYWREQCVGGVVKRASLNLAVRGQLQGHWIRWAAPRRQHSVSSVQKRSNIFFTCCSIKRAIHIFLVQPNFVKTNTG